MDAGIFPKIKTGSVDLTNSTYPEAPAVPLSSATADRMVLKYSVDV